MKLAILFRSLPLLIVSSTVVAALLATAKEPAASNTPGADKLARMAQPEFNEEGALLRPEGYERWTLVGTSIGLDYSPAKENENAAADKPGIFHNVYVQPEAFDHYVEHGEFPEQTVFVVTNNPPMKKEGENDINRKGLFAGEPTGLEVSVKDSKRYEEGWGFFMYYGTKGQRAAAKPLARQACYDCHAEHGEDDAVFVQFYTVLKSARAKKAAAK